MSRLWQLTKNECEHGDHRLFAGEILVEFFGFPCTARLRDSTGDYCLGQHFDRAAIGKERYATATSSVSRSLRRLEDRGFVHRIYGAFGGWTAVSLTDKGRLAAKLREAAEE